MSEPSASNVPVIKFTAQDSLTKLRADVASLERAVSRISTNVEGHTQVNFEFTQQITDQLRMIQDLTRHIEGNEEYAASIRSTMEAVAAEVERVNEKFTFIDGELAGIESATGTNTNWYTSTAPTSEDGAKEGDLWFTPEDTIKKFVSGAWVDITLSGTMLDEMSAEKIVGTITAAQIADGTVTSAELSQAINDQIAQALEDASQGILDASSAQATAETVLNEFVSFEWDATPSASQTIKRINGVEVLRNLATRPDAMAQADPYYWGLEPRWFGSGSAGTTQWGVTGSGITGGPDTFARKTWTSVSAAGDVSFTLCRVGAKPGASAETTYTVGFWWRPSWNIGGPAGLLNKFQVDYYDETGTRIYYEDSPAGVAAPAPGEWQWLSHTFTTPANTVNVLVYHKLYCPTAPGVGDTLDATGVIMVEGSFPNLSYFDGNTEDGPGHVVTSSIKQIAESKNQVIYSVLPALGTQGFVTGDLWIQRDGFDNIIGQWQFSGTEWQLSPFDGSKVIAAHSILADQLAANSITSDKIVADAVVADKIAADAVTANKIAAGTIAVGSAIIADGAIRNAQIADATIEHAKIATIDASKITVNKLTGNQIDANTITANHITADAVDTTKLTADAINGMTITGATFKTGPETGQNTVISPEGIVFSAKPMGEANVRQVAQMGTAYSAVWSVFNASNEVIAGTTTDGHVVARSVQGEDVMLMGNSLLAYFNNFPRGQVAFVEKYDAMTTNAAEQIYVRLKFRAEAGRLYRISTSSINYKQNGGTGVGGVIRFLWQNNGGTVTSASAEVERTVVTGHAHAFENNNGPSFMYHYDPTVSEDIEVGIGFVGTSASTLTIYNTVFSVEDMGPSMPATVGIRRKTTWVASASALWRKDTSVKVSSTKIQQGLAATWGNVISYLAFTNAAAYGDGVGKMLSSEMTGATILSAKLSLHNQSTNLPEGATAVAAPTTHTSTTTLPPTPTNVIEKSVAPGAWVSLDITSLWTNLMRGITLGGRTADAGNLFSAIFHNTSSGGYRPQLEIEYTRSS